MEFVSDRLESMRLYSSQLVIPSSSASSHRSLGCNGLSVHSSSMTFHRANQISQPSGIPSSSESALNGSVEPFSIGIWPARIAPLARDAKSASGSPKSEILSNKSVVKPFGSSIPSNVWLSKKRPERMWYSR